MSAEVADYVLKRMVWAVALFFILTFVTFVIFYVIPHSSGAVIGRSIGQQDFRNQVNSSGSLVAQYWHFISNALQGNFGRSISNGRTVSSIIRNAAPVTMALVFGGAIFWMLIAIPVGVISALHPRTLFDRAGMIFVFIGISVHPVWLGLMFSYWFGYRLGWFPESGYCDAINPITRCGGPGPWAYHMILPWTTVALLFGAFYARMIRANVKENLHEDWVRTARAKGASEWTVVRNHVLRLALLPVMAALAIDIGGLALGVLGVSLFVETAFGLPGLGRTAATALQRNDLPVIVGIVVFVTVVIVVMNLIADILFAVLDPRVKLQTAHG
jgi:peptide/nickel transport system permease protein